MKSIRKLARWLTPKNDEDRLGALKAQTKASPNSDRAWLRLADAHLLAKDEASALLALWRAAELNIEKERPARIAAIARRITLLAPASSRAHLTLGRALDESGLLTDAAQALNTAAKLLQRERQTALAEQAQARADALFEEAAKIDYIAPERPDMDRFGSEAEDDSPTIELSPSALRAIAYAEAKPEMTTFA